MVDLMWCATGLLSMLLDVTLGSGTAALGVGTGTLLTGITVRNVVKVVRVQSALEEDVAGGAVGR